MILADPMNPWAAGALAATLGLDRVFEAGDAVEPFWHWLHFLEAAPIDALGRDGHPATGGFIPKLAQPRRMWAGGRVRWDGALRYGTPAERHSEVIAVEEKTGRTGPLGFVTVRHRISQAGATVLEEEQDLVYREEADPSAPARPPRPAPGDEDHSAAWTLGPVALFRYSALTFNGHRIHYDADYAREVEGYPGLVVHGPLLATLMLALVDRPARFAFRAEAPVFAGERFTICRAPGEDGATRLWVRGEDGRLAMQGEAG